jgi:chromosome partitioning protein
LAIIPSDVDLSGAELELSNAPRRSYRLRHAVERFRKTSLGRSDAAIIS